MPGQPSQPHPRPRRRSRWRVAGPLLAAAVAVYALSGFYFVDPDEQAVVRWFGRIPEGQMIGPGLRYAPPWPVCRVDTPKTTEMRRAYVGLLPEQREAIARGSVGAIQDSTATDILTGDSNILKVTLVVQYRLSDPAAYLTNTEAPDRLVRSAVQAALVEGLGSLPVDRALTTAKGALQNDVIESAQRLLDSYGAGVRLAGAQLDTIEPPRAVADAFKDVVSAKKDGERMVDQARADANSILPQARGDAERLLREAEGYGLAKVSRAQGDADRFVSLLTEYHRAPDVTRDRLWLEAFDRVLPRVRLYVLDDPGDGAPSRIRIVGRPAS